MFAGARICLEMLRMSVRQRTWTKPDGSAGAAWVVDYVDQHGKRHLKTFRRKRDADAYHASTVVDVRKGVHAADSTSITVAQAGALWLATSEANGVERATLVYYRQHVELHINPLIGGIRLSQLTAPMVRRFEDQLRHDRSPDMVRRVV